MLWKYIFCNRCHTNVLCPVKIYRHFECDGKFQFIRASRFLKPKKLQTVVRKIVLSVSTNATVQLNHSCCTWLAGCELLSAGRDSSILCMEFFLPLGTQLNLFWCGDLCYGWSALFGYLRSVCLLLWDLGRFVLCISGVTAVSCAGLWCFLLLSFEHRRDGCDGTAESRPSWNQPWFAELPEEVGWVML